MIIATVTHAPAACWDSGVLYSCPANSSCDFAAAALEFNIYTHRRPELRKAVFRNITAGHTATIFIPTLQHFLFMLWKIVVNGYRKWHKYINICSETNSEQTHTYSYVRPCDVGKHLTLSHIKYSTDVIPVSNQLDPLFLITLQKQ